MNNEVVENIACEALVRSITNGSALDHNNLLWKVVDGKWIGKRSVWTHDRRACWLEDATHEDVQSWWCGEHADYAERFARPLL